MTTVEGTLARCEELSARGEGAAPEDVAWLVGCFDHPLKAVRRAAGLALIALAAAGVRVADSLEAAMRDGTFRRRWVAAWTASRVPGSWSAVRMDVLVEALGTDDGDVRWAAARILTGAPRSDATVLRLRGLAGAANPEQRKMALYCLRDLGSPDAETVACYRGALRDPAPGVRLAAMSGLARVPVRTTDDARDVAALLDDPDGGVRRAAAATLGRMGVADGEVVARLGQAAASEDRVLGRTARAAIAALS